jgi:hypothetical protein
MCTLPEPYPKEFCDDVMNVRRGEAGQKIKQIASRGGGVGRTPVSPHGASLWFKLPDERRLGPTSRGEGVLHCQVAERPLDARAVLFLK